MCRRALDEELQTYSAQPVSQMSCLVRHTWNAPVARACEPSATNLALLGIHLHCRRLLAADLTD